ncbi:hypothetical protein SUGI_0092450 [Cryptomeria japonica]|nr:hypothetical protein SUGI_0092450 [Cryptomeria japonica]
MAFNTRYSAEKRTEVNPKDLRITQPDIKSTFTDPTYPSVRDTASLMQRGHLSPDALGPLHVSTDKHGRTWCDNNRRLFAYKEAAVDSVPVVFDGIRRPKSSKGNWTVLPSFYDGAIDYEKILVKERPRASKSAQIVPTAQTSPSSTNSSRHKQKSPMPPDPTPSLTSKDKKSSSDKANTSCSNSMTKASISIEKDTRSSSKEVLQELLHEAHYFKADVLE